VDEIEIPARPVPAWFRLPFAVVLALIESEASDVRELNALPVTFIRDPALISMLPTEYRSRLPRA
jgi:hypothetical protein